MGEQLLSVLAEVSRRVAESPDLESALGAVATHALALTGADHASVRLCDHGAEVVPGARAGVGLDRDPPPFRKGQGVLGWVAETGKVARVDDGASDPRFRPTPERGFAVRSILSVPLCTTAGVVGVLSLSAPRAHAFDATHESIGLVLASAAAQAVHAGRLEQIAVTDEQTGAYNHRYLFPRLREELSRARRAGRPLCALLLDLDHFKRVNDEYGHSVGDEVLRRIASLVRGCIRAPDVLVRRGGEEFVLLLPDTDLAGGRELAERIRLAVMSEPISVAPRMWVVQTLSIGVARWDGEESAEALDRRADAAMYGAKRAGRNRVVVFDALALGDAADRPRGGDPSDA